MVKQTLLFEGPLTRSGYGQRSKDLVLALIKSEKYQVWIFPTKWGNTPSMMLSESKDDEVIKSCIRSEINQKPDIHIQVTIPSEFRPLGTKSIGITAGTETTSAPLSWLEGCNRMDAVFFSSNHSKNVFESLQYKKDNQTIKLVKPSEWLFEGIDLSVFNKEFNPASGVSKHLNIIPENFAFLCVGHWLQGNLGHDRKDIGMVIHTFLNVFRRKASHNRPCLILKSSGAGFSISERDVIIEKINQIQESIRNQFGFKGEFPKIYLLHGDLLDSEMNDLYNHPKVKALVSFHKGEGWGRPLLEFTTTGKPVIASKWSAPLDFLDPEYSVFLPGHLTQVDGSASNEWIQRDAHWFTVNYNFAGQILNDVYEHYDRYLEKSRKHAKITRDNFSLEKMSDKFLELLEKYSILQNNKPTINLPKLKKVV